MTEARITAAAVYQAVRQLTILHPDGQRVSVQWQFLSRAADTAGVTRYDGVQGTRKDWEYFCGQVGRALNRLVQEGELVKVPLRHGRGLEFLTQQQHAARQAADSCIRVARQARDAERERVYDELLVHGIPVESERGQEIRLSFTAWSHVLTALDAMVAGRSEG